jgi:RNA polymerase sigma factor (TIGR02999 family)
MSDAGDVARMVEEVYADLHRLAEGYVRRERANSVQATDLLHDTFLRLARNAPPQWQNRSHFVAIAAIAMRRLLVERARARHAAKRGGVQVQITLNETVLVDDAASHAIDLIALDRALTELGRIDQQQARIIELRYFGGLSVEETAEALDISTSTVKRDWTVARAWLLRAMDGAPRA